MTGGIISITKSLDGIKNKFQTRSKRVSNEAQLETTMRRVKNEFQTRFKALQARFKRSCAQETTDDFRLKNKIGPFLSPK